jgi:hypothetical protein
MVETTDYGSNCEPPLVYVTPVPPSTSVVGTRHTVEAPAEYIRAEEEYSTDSEGAYPPFPDNNTRQATETPPSKYYHPTDVTVPLLVSASDADSNHYRPQSPFQGSHDEEEDPFQKKLRRRMRRKRRMAVGGVTGIIVGTAIGCGPIGAVVGAVTGVFVARAVSKSRELAKDERCRAGRQRRLVGGSPSTGLKSCSEPKQLD